MKRLALTVALLVFTTISAFAQDEILTNAHIIELTAVGLDKALIIKKINEAKNTFDVSVNSLIELRKANVDSDVIALMMERAPKKTVAAETKPADTGAEAKPTETPKPVPAEKFSTAKESLMSARSIAIVKSSLNPSKQSLEKELLKRPEFKKLNLTITEYKEDADLYIDISFVHMSLITHRYTYRIYDRRNGAVLGAGETTSWGSLSSNLASNIGKTITKILDGK